MICTDRMDLIVCQLSQISTAMFDQKNTQMEIDGIRITDALIFGKVISVRDKVQLILDHNGYKCKITVRDCYTGYG